MNKKIVRYTDLLIEMYNYYSPKRISLKELYYRLETYGYEIEKDKIFKGAFDELERVPSLLLLATYIINESNPTKKAKFIYINLKDIKIVEDYLMIRYTKEPGSNGELQPDNHSVVINDYVYRTINSKHQQINLLSESEDIHPELYSSAGIMDEINTLAQKPMLGKPYHQNSINKLNDLRDYFMNAGFKEIMTHPIIDKATDIREGHKLNIPFLSHNYIRHTISEAYIYEYDQYKKYCLCFEISNVFDMIKYKASLSLFLSLNKLLYSDENLIKKLQEAGICNRAVIIDNNVLQINGSVRKIGVIKNYQKHKLIELDLSITSSKKPKDLYEYKIYNINVVNFTTKDIINIYLLNHRIVNIEITDIYENKYTIRLYTSLEYDHLIKFISRVVKDRIRL